ncbi:hypothetical protein BU15DRAFT_49540 [Melanogaster broomeanus]|nr:hypothetical protein BU15DRAFT_49540 [Melanogaster broomeanus]
MSKVGNPQIYEDHEQRTSKQTDHNLPPKKVPDERYIDIEELDERGIGEMMAKAHELARERSISPDRPGADPKINPLGPAIFHGNEPSWGAKVDAEIMAEEREELRRKGKA